MPHPPLHHHKAPPPPTIWRLQGNKQHHRKLVGALPTGGLSGSPLAGRGIVRETVAPLTSTDTLGMRLNQHAGLFFFVIPDRPHTHMRGIIQHTRR